MNKYGGWTMIGFIARNFRTKNRMKYWQNYPDARNDRRSGDTIMFKGDMRGCVERPCGAMQHGVRWHTRVCMCHCPRVCYKGLQRAAARCPAHAPRQRRGWRRTPLRGHTLTSNVVRAQV